MSDFDIGEKVLHTGPAGTVTVQYRGRTGDDAVVVFPGGLQHMVPLDRLRASPDTPKKNPRFPGPGGSGSRPISELGPRVKRSVTISPENSAWLDASGCKRSALVNLALDGLRAAHGDDWPRVRALLDAGRV